MSCEKITQANKKKITSDWNNLFPSLAIYKPMHLMNRLGPLLVGIILEVKSGKTDYIPTYHVHSLMRPFPAISLTLETTLNYVKLEWHDSKFHKLAQLMKENALIPFEGDIHLKTVLLGYKKHLLKSSIPCQPHEYEDMALISAWCNNKSEVKNSLEFAEMNMKKWPTNVLKRIGGIESWINSVKEKTIDIDTLKSIVDKQIVELKVEGLPVRNLLS